MKFNSKNQFKLCLLVLIFPQIYHAYKYLYVHQTTSPSHVIQGKLLAKEMVKRGHHVTAVTPFPTDKPMKNYRDIHLHDFLEKVNATSFLPSFKKSLGLRNLIEALMTEERQPSYVLFSDPQFQEILKEKFDAIIIGIFLSDAVTVLGHHFNAPMIGFLSAADNFFSDMYVGNPSLYAILPNPMLEYTDKMNFNERLINTIYSFLLKSFLGLMIYSENKIKDKFFPNSPSVEECRKNFSILLLNTDLSYSYARPNVPSIIPIGGFYMDEPNPLPEHLQAILDSATNGVIYFSMGSNLKSVDMPAEKRNEFLIAFKRLKQTILWKWEDVAMEHKPDNVILEKWLPQADLLAHPNVKLFITHGGQGSVVESIKAAVPMVFIPMFGDQIHNAKKGEVEGFGKRINFDNFTSNELYLAITEVLTNQSYKEVIRVKRRILNEKPIKAMDLAMFWVEYVAKYQGAPHLRSSTASLSYAQLYLLDVIAFILVVIIIALIVTYYALRTIKRILWWILKRKMKVKTQ